MNDFNSDSVRNFPVTVTEGMRTFSANDCLHLWEQGARLHVIDQALLVLSRAFPEANRDALMQLSLGQRDRLLLAVRQHNFGDCIDVHTTCAACSERAEFSVSCSALLADTVAAEAPAKKVTLDGAAFELRCPNSLDLAEAARGPSLEAAERVLLDRCVTHNDAAPITPARRAALAAALSALDPAAEIMFDLACPACCREWQALFDINQLLWLEIAARARRLVQEVDVLARVYHWHEAEIFALSENRRALYLEMALS